MPAAAAAGTYTAGRGQQLSAALARLVISPADSSVRVGASRAYTAEGYNSAGRDLGDVTSATQFSIDPDGSCGGSHCTAATPGRHTIAGTVRVHNRVITGTADLQVVDSQTGRSLTGSAHGDSARGQATSGAGTPSGDRTSPQHGDTAGQPTGHQTGDTQQVARLVLRPGRAFMRSGGSMTYVAEAFDAANHDLGDVTSRTTFSISFSAAKSNVRARPDGSCADATCTAGKLGRHTVTGAADLGNGTISGTAALQVVPRHRGVRRTHGPPHRPPAQLATLKLIPPSAVIESGAKKKYKALGYDAAGHFLGNLTRFTHFKIWPDGSCHFNICTATATQPRMHTVTGTIFLKKRHVTGFASLLVVPRIIGFVLDPKFAVITVNDSIAYIADGVIAPDVDVDLTPYTKFRIEPPGFCAANICSASTPDQYEVTGTLDLGDRTLTAPATLVVAREPIVGLRLIADRTTALVGEHAHYRAEGIDGQGRAVADLTPITSLTINHPPHGFCRDSDHSCWAGKPDRYTVTGSAAVDGRLLQGTATLRVTGTSPPPPFSLTVTPDGAVINAGGSVSYSAEAKDASGSPVADLTADSSFTITRGDSCTGNRCTATKLGVHTVTATANFRGQTIIGKAKLLVVADTVIDVGLAPKSAVIKSGESIGYTTTGTEANGHGPVNLTGFTSFSISPDGSCDGATCTATELGPHTVTATVNLASGQITRTAKLLVVAEAVIELGLTPEFEMIRPGGSIAYATTGTEANGDGAVKLTGFTSFSISPDGSCTGATCTATKLGRHVVTATVNLATSQVIQTAELLVTTNPRCEPSSRDVIRRLQVSPRKGPPGTRVRITTRLTRQFAHCPVAFLLGGSRFGGATVQPDGSVSLQGALPNDAKPGVTRIRLATTSGQILGTTTFDVTSLGFIAGLWHRTPPWLRIALAVLLLLALALAAVTGDRPRRQRRWVRHHVRTEARPSPEDVTAARDAEAGPGFSVRVQPRAGTSTTEIHKEGD